MCCTSVWDIPRIVASAKHCFPEGILHLLVSQAVDGWVKEWYNDGVEYRNNFVVVEAIHGPRSCIGEESGGIVDNNHCQVGGTGGKGFVASLGSRDP